MSNCISKFVYIALIVFVVSIYYTCQGPTGPQGPVGEVRHDTTYIITHDTVLTRDTVITRDTIIGYDTITIKDTIVWYDTVSDSVSNIPEKSYVISYI